MNVTWQDYFSPFSNFNLTRMLIGLIFTFVVGGVITFFKYRAQKYEEDDKDPYESTTIL